VNPVTAHGDDPTSDLETAVLESTRRWIERAVIGLNLCPFARLPFHEQRVRFAISDATERAGVLDDLCGELQSLQAADPAECETTLLILPRAFAEFLEFNDFLDEADAALDVLKLVGEIQVASFHPGYRFADSAEDDVENCTNRAPYPILHLLRETSVERAALSMADTGVIVERNLDTLRRLGWDGWNALWQAPVKGA
jgi:hypothetical protein